MAEERSDLAAFYLVFAINLFDEQFTVAKNQYFFSTTVFCGFEGFYDAGIFSYVVRSLAEEEGFGL